MALSRCWAVRAIPCQAQRTELVAGVPRGARYAGDAPARRNPCCNSSSTVGASPIATDAAPADRPAGTAALPACDPVATSADGIDPV